MVSNYNREYTKKEIALKLEEIQDCVRNYRYTISLNPNRTENIDFINEYNITSKKQRSILLKIKLEDFCCSVKNKNVGFEYEILYIFAPKVNFFNIEGAEETFVVYSKFNVIQDNNNRVVVISFHKANWEIDYCFT